jgi:hypothetical protein|tara:strand:- start:42 stop:242 length:201 start_codon:yes stop_codon:yes gene_type:complete
MRIKTTNIDWDTDNEQVDLPQVVELEIDGDNDEEGPYEIADKLSDEYGWCIRGLAYEIISGGTGWE